MARPKRVFTDKEEKKEVFLSRKQIRAIYLDGIISLDTLINCLTPGLICFKVSNGNTIY